MEINIKIEVLYFRKVIRKIIIIFKFNFKQFFFSRNLNFCYYFNIFSFFNNVNQANLFSSYFSSAFSQPLIFTSPTDFPCGILPFDIPVNVNFTQNEAFCP